MEPDKWSVLLSHTGWNAFCAPLGRIVLRLSHTQVCTAHAVWEFVLPRRKTVDGLGVGGASTRGLV